MQLSHWLISKVGRKLLVRRKHISYIKAFINTEVFVQSILLMFKVISIDEVEYYPLLNILLISKRIEYITFLLH